MVYTYARACNALRQFFECNFYWVYIVCIPYSSRVVVVVLVVVVVVGVDPLRAFVTNNYTDILTDACVNSSISSRKIRRTSNNYYFASVYIYTIRIIEFKRKTRPAPHPRESAALLKRPTLESWCVQTTLSEFQFENAKLTTRATATAALHATVLHVLSPCRPAERWKTGEIRCGKGRDARSSLSLINRTLW